MPTRSERKTFKEFKQRYPRSRGFEHFEKPAIDCEPHEPCVRVQPDMVAIHPRTGRTIVGDDKDKLRVDMSDVLKLRDDMRRVKRVLQVPKVKGEMYVKPWTAVSDRVLTAARRRGIDVLERE